MAHKLPRISIVIPAYNCADTVSYAIEACLNQDYPKDRTEIIIVDDDSTDDTRETVKNYPVKYIYHQKRRGPAAARNTGWKDSSGEGICFTDADCAPRRDWVSMLSRNFGDESIAAIAGSYDVKSCEHLLDKLVHYEIKYRHGMMRDYPISFGTYNVLIKRSVLEKLGGFDSAYSMASGEDTDISYRMAKSGYRIYFEKDALVGHNNILKFATYMKTQFRHGFWRMKLYRKNINMIKKDEYGYWKDFLETGLVLSLLPLLMIRPFASLYVLAFIFALQVPLAIKIILERKDFRCLIFSSVTFVRAFARVTGGVCGFIVFWLLKR